MKRALTPAIALAAVLAAVLAGCASPAETPSPSESPVASVSPAPSPTRMPSVSPEPSVTPAGFECPVWSDDPDDAVAAISPTSYAGICLGTSFADAPATTGATITPVESCPWYGQIVADDELGFYVGAVTDPEAPGESIWLFTMQWLGDPAAAGSFEMPATPEGITIGASVANVSAAYPDATEVFFDDMARGERHQFVVDNGDDLSYNFDIIDDVVTEVTWGIGIGEGGPNNELCAL